MLPRLPRQLPTLRCSSTSASWRLYRSIEVLPRRNLVTTHSRSEDMAITLQRQGRPETSNSCDHHLHLHLHPQPSGTTTTQRPSNAQQQHLCTHLHAQLLRRRLVHVVRPVLLQKLPHVVAVAAADSVGFPGRVRAGRVRLRTRPIHQRVMGWGGVGWDDMGWHGDGEFGQPLITFTPSPLDVGVEGKLTLRYVCVHINTLRSCVLLACLLWNPTH